MSQPAQPESFAAWLKDNALAVSAVIGAVTAALTLWIKWDDWIAKKHACELIGAVYDKTNGQPLAGADVGFSPYVNSVVDFLKLGETAPNGAFDVDCASSQSYAGSSFVILVRPNCGPLPSGRIAYTYVTARKTGKQQGVNLNVYC